MPWWRSCPESAGRRGQALANTTRNSRALVRDGYDESANVGGHDLENGQREGQRARHLDLTVDEPNLGRYLDRTGNAVEGQIASQRQFGGGTREGCRGDIHGLVLPVPHLG